MFPMVDDIPTLRLILKGCHTIAIVGLSAEWHRPSNFVAKYLQGHGYRIVPVNPRYAASNTNDGTSILGETSYARLEDIPFAVDMVDVFRKPADVTPIAASAVAIGARCLWQQLGVMNMEADAIARAAGLDSVMNRCVKIEHARLFGGLNWVGVDTKVISARRPA
jgi:predicted CoA-binding protein